MYTHIEQILIHTYACNFKIQGEYKQAKKIFSFILSILDDYPKTKYKHYYKYAEKSLYMSCIQNLSAIAYLECNYILDYLIYKKDLNLFVNTILLFISQFFYKKNFAICVD